jgi:hypothetical protein
LSGLLAQLKSLGERSNAAIGGAYALAARSVLGRLERLEDLNAERRFRQRPRAPSSAGAKETPSASLPSPLPSTQ